ncbi:hypothetical protein RG959_01725 [Domibacillus sp. 8LH]|uniref:hypothetical protein n=1 Tax=Domibacillus sp. 8LH TaxID=3073900 RepID=UPI00317B7457
MNKVKENNLKAFKLFSEISRIWHKHSYLKYEHLEVGCINKKIRKELNEKKAYHYKKYVQLSLSSEEKVRA